MNKLSRRFSQLFTKSSRRTRQRRTNRLLHSEQLEGRVLLAANILHNELTAEDVNNDGHVVAGDVLAVVNALTSGNRQAEGEDGRPLYLDVNDDGALAPSDALAVINKILLAEGENPAQIVSYEPMALATNFVAAPRRGGFDFVDNGSTDQIVIDGDASWLDAGFTVGGTVLIANSGTFVDTVENPPVPDDERNFELDTHIHNNGLFNIVAVTADTLTVDADLNTVFGSNVRSTDSSGFPLAGEPIFSQSALFFRPVTSVSAGSDFFLGMVVQDLRTENSTGQPLPSASKGVFSATTDVVFDVDKVTANGTSNSDIVLANNFSTRSTSETGTFATAGLIDEAGASAFGEGVGIPTGGNKQLLFRTSFTAGTMTGTTTISTNVAEQSPANDTLLFGLNTAIPETMISYGSLDLRIVADVVAEDDLANGQPIATVSEGSATVELNVLANDEVLVPTGGTATIESVTQPQAGAGSVSHNGSSLFYTPPASVGTTPVDATFTYTINNGQGATDSATVTVRVNPVNDDPTITAPATVTATEDTLLNIVGVSVADPDDNSLTVTLDVSNGTLSAGSETGASITLTGTPATVNTSLSGLTYTPNADVDTSDTLMIGVTDGIIANPVTSNVSINITAVDDPTVLTLPGDQTVFLGESLVFSAGNSNAIALTDVDSTLTVTVSLDATKDGSITAGSQSGKSITLTGSAASVTSQLSGLTFSHTLASPFDTTLTVSSANGTTISDNLTISVIPQTVPFAAGNSFTFNEDSQAQTFDVLANDIKADGNTLSITQLDANGVTVTPGNSTTLASGVLALATDGSNVTFTPTANASGDFNFTYTIAQASDVGDGPSTGSVAVSVVPVNDAPTLVVPGAQTIAEEGSFSLSGVSVADIDGDALTVSITSTSGSFALSSPGTVSASPTATGITLNGSVADINTALDNLTYSPDTNFNGSDTLNVSVSDNNTGTASGSIGVTVTAVNDDPTIAVPGSQSFFKDINNPFVGSFSVADVDADPSDVRVSLSITSGTLAVSQTTNVAVASITNGISLTGAIADVNASLATLSYTGSTSGDFTLNAAVNDLGNTGSGGGQDVTGTVAVNVLDFVPATITGKIFTDSNGNSVQDGDEMGLGGVQVTLSGEDFQGASVTKTTTTNADGSYTFTDVVPNKQGTPYVITQSQSAFFQSNGSTLAVDVNLQGQSTMTGALSTGNLKEEFADVWSRFEFGGGTTGAELQTGVVFGFDGTSQSFSTVDGNGWDTTRFSNFRLAVNSSDGDSAVLTVFDSSTGADRSVSVSVAAGTLSHYGSGNDEIYRVIGSSSLLSGSSSAAGEGESSISGAQFTAAADDIFSRMGM